MKILKGKVRWYEGAGNAPTFELLVSNVPASEDLRFTKKDLDEEQGSLYYAEKDGFVQFFSWDGPRNEGGYGGAQIPIIMVGGNEIVLKGPWSSRAGVMNANGFGPCVDVAYITDHGDYKRGHTFFRGHVTLDLIREALSRIDIGPGFTYRGGEGYYPLPEPTSFKHGRAGIALRLKQNDEPVYEPVVILPYGRIWRKKRI